MGQQIQSDEFQQDLQAIWNQEFESQNSNQASQIQIENRKEKEIIGSYYSKNQEISVIMEMGRDQEDEMTSNRESAGIRKNSDFSKYTTTYVINQNECLSNSSIAQGSISQLNRFKQHFNSQQRSRKQKRQSLNISQIDENKYPDNLTVIENIVDEQDPDLLQPCIISNAKQFSSNFQNIVKQSDLVNLKNEEKQEFLEFLKEENEKEIQKDKKYNQMQKELFKLENNLKNEKGLHQQELDSHKLQIWILEDKIQQMNDQIVQIEIENNSHSQKVTDIVQQIQSVKSEIQNKDNQVLEVQQEYDQYKNIQAELLQNKEISENEFQIISNEIQEEKNKLIIVNEEKILKQLQFDELTIKEQELENQKNIILQNKNNLEIQIYKQKKELIKLEEETVDSKQNQDRNVLEKDMFETQLSFYLKQQSILTKDIDVFQKKKQFHLEFIHYGDKNNKSLFKIIQDNYQIIENLRNNKLQIIQELDILANDQNITKCQIDQLQTNILNLNANLDKLYNLSNNRNNIYIDINQNKGNKDQQIAIEKEEEKMIEQKVQIKRISPKTKEHSRMNSIQNLITIQNSRQQSTCHTRSQTVCEDDLNVFYQRKNQNKKVQYFVDEPITYRESIKNEQIVKDNQDRKSECITIQNQVLEQFQYQDNQSLNKKQNANQNDAQKAYKQKIKELAIPQLQSKSPFNLNNILTSKNSLLSQETKLNSDMPLTRTLQNCVPLNQKNAKKNKCEGHQQLNCLKNQKLKENQVSSHLELEENSKNEINLNSINPLRKTLNLNNYKHPQSKSSDYDKQNKKIQKMNIGKQLNRYIDEIEYKNNKNKQQYNQICFTVKNIIKKSDRNQIIDKKSKRTNKSSEYSIANGSKCSTFRQNLESEKKLIQKNNVINKVQIDKRNRCLARFVHSKNLIIPDEPFKKQKLKQFIKTDMPKFNEDLEHTLKSKSQSQSMSSTHIFEMNQIRNSLPFRKKQDISLDINKQQYKYSFKIPTEKMNIINYENQQQQQEGSQFNQQQQMFKSKTAQRLIQQNQFISQRTLDNIQNKHEFENINKKFEINEKNSFPLRRSFSNNQNMDLKQRYQSDNIKPNILNQNNQGMKQIEDQIKYSKYIKPLRQNKNLSHTLCSESHALSPSHYLKFNTEIDDCLSNKFERQIQNIQKQQNQNHVTSPDIKYKVFKKSISSNLLTGYQGQDYSVSQDQFEFKSKFAKQSLERKNTIISQKHQYFINEIFKNENSNPKEQKKGIKQIQDSYFTDGLQQHQPKTSELTNSNSQQQTHQKYSKYLLENLNKNSITSEQGANYFNIAQKNKNVNLSISNPQNISSIEYKNSQPSNSFENSQNQLIKVIQKEFTNQGELSLKSNFAKRKFEMHFDQVQFQQAANIIQNQEQLQSSKDSKKSSSIKKKSKHSKLSQFLQPISKCDDASSKNCEQKNYQYQQKMQEELKILQAQIFQEVKKVPNSPKQPKSAFIGRKKGKIQDDISCNLNEQMELLQSSRIIPATPNDSMKKEMPLNIYEGENLRIKNQEYSPDQKKNCKISSRQNLKEDKENISPAKSTIKSKNSKLIILDQERAKINLEYKENKDVLKEDLYSDDSHISLREQDEIISQLKSNKEITNHF